MKFCHFIWLELLGIVLSLPPYVGFLCRMEKQSGASGNWFQLLRVPRIPREGGDKVRHVIEDDNLVIDSRQRINLLKSASKIPCSYLSNWHWFYNHPHLTTSPCVLWDLLDLINKHALTLESSSCWHYVSLDFEVDK